MCYDVKVGALSTVFQSSSDMYSIAVGADVMFSASDSHSTESKFGTTYCRYEVGQLCSTTSSICQFYLSIYTCTNNLRAAMKAGICD